MKAIDENQQLLIFRVGPIACCVSLKDVDSIVNPQPLHKLPGQADYILGILQYRDSTVSIVNLFYNFKLDTPADNNIGRYIMAYTRHGVAGFWVDEVIEVSDEYDQKWTKAPLFLPENIFDKILIRKERMVLLTDFDRLFAMDNIKDNPEWAKDKSLAWVDENETTLEAPEILIDESESVEKIQALEHRGENLSQVIISEIYDSEINRTEDVESRLQEMNIDFGNAINDESTLDISGTSSSTIILNDNNSEKIETRIEDSVIKRELIENLESEKISIIEPDSELQVESKITSEIESEFESKFENNSEIEGNKIQTEYDLSTSFLETYMDAATQLKHIAPSEFVLTSSINDEIIYLTDEEQKSEFVEVDVPTAQNSLLFTSDESFDVIEEPTLLPMDFENSTFHLTNSQEYGGSSTIEESHESINEYTNSQQDNLVFETESTIVSENSTVSMHDYSDTKINNTSEEKNEIASEVNSEVTKEITKAATEIVGSRENMSELTLIIPEFNSETVQLDYLEDDTLETEFSEKPLPENVAIPVDITLDSSLESTNSDETEIESTIDVGAEDFENDVEGYFNHNLQEQVEIYQKSIKLQKNNVTLNNTTNDSENISFEISAIDISRDNFKESLVSQVDHSIPTGLTKLASLIPDDSDIVSKDVISKRSEILSDLDVALSDVNISSSILSIADEISEIDKTLKMRPTTSTAVFSENSSTLTKLVVKDKKIEMTNSIVNSENFPPEDVLSEEVMSEVIITEFSATNISMRKGESSDSVITEFENQQNDETTRQGAKRKKREAFDKVLNRIDKSQPERNATAPLRLVASVLLVASGIFIAEHYQLLPGSVISKSADSLTLLSESHIFQDEINASASGVNQLIDIALTLPVLTVAEFYGDPFTVTFNDIPAFTRSYSLPELEKFSKNLVKTITLLPELLNSIEIIESSLKLNSSQIVENNTALTKNSIEQNESLKLNPSPKIIDGIKISRLMTDISTNIAHDELEKKTMPVIEESMPEKNIASKPRKMDLVTNETSLVDKNEIDDNDTEFVTIAMNNRFTKPINKKIDPTIATIDIPSTQDVPESQVLHLPKPSRLIKPFKSTQPNNQVTSTFPDNIDKRLHFTWQKKEEPEIKEKALVLTKNQATNDDISQVVKIAMAETLIKKAARQSSKNLPTAVDVNKAIQIAKFSQREEINQSRNLIKSKFDAAVFFNHHTVIRGDTLWDIADTYLNNPFRYPDLARWSNIKNPDLIYPDDDVKYIQLEKNK